MAACTAGRRERGWEGNYLGECDSREELGQGPGGRLAIITDVGVGVTCYKES